MTVRSGRTLGATVRAARQEKGISLRKFAGMVGVSATFISMIELDGVQSAKGGGDLPIKEATIIKIADALGLNADDLLALAGKLPADIQRIIHRHPQEMAALLRSARHLSPEEIARVTKKIDRDKKS